MSSRFSALLPPSGRDNAYSALLAALKLRTPIQRGSFYHPRAIQGQLGRFQAKEGGIVELELPSSSAQPPVSTSLTLSSPAHLYYQLPFILPPLRIGKKERKKDNKLIVKIVKETQTALLPPVSLPPLSLHTPYTPHPDRQPNPHHSKSWASLISNLTKRGNGSTMASSGSFVVVVESSAEEGFGVGGGGAAYVDEGREGEGI